MKDTYYFSHDYNARNDPKLQKVLMKLGQAGKGLYWDLIEMLYEEGGYLMLSECDAYAFALRSDSDCINSLINDFGLFLKNDTQFWSESVLRRLNKRKEKSDKAAQSAQKRWNNANASKPDANALRPECEGNAIKERKGKENKDTSEIPPEFIEAYKLYPSRKKRSVSDEFDHLKKTCKNYKEILKSLPAAVEAFNKDMESQKTEPRFIKHMQGWITDKRWGAYIDETGSLTSPTPAPVEFKEPKAFKDTAEHLAYWSGVPTPTSKVA